MLSVFEIKPDIVSSDMLPMSGQTGGFETVLTFSLPTNPITVTNDVIDIEKDAMEINKCHSFIYKDKSYFAIKTATNVIDIYKVE